jgi:calcineurin-like phosphoesterase family protein
MIYIASDIHLGHFNILKYCPERNVIPYDGIREITHADVSAMNELIITNWNSIITTEDTVFILGDFLMGIVANSIPLIRRLNGSKILIRGNHDKTLSKLIKNDSSLSDLFESVHDYYEYFHMHDGKNRMICMSHFPMRHWHGQNAGSIMLHGHLHGSPCDVPGRIKDVGIDTNNLRPYLLDDVVAEMMKIESFEEHHKEGNL